MLPPIEAPIIIADFEDDVPSDPLGPLVLDPADPGPEAEGVGSKFLGVYDVVHV